MFGHFVGCILRSERKQVLLFQSLMYIVGDESHVYNGFTSYSSGHKTRPQKMSNPQSVDTIQTKSREMDVPRSYRPGCVTWRSKRKPLALPIGLFGHPRCQTRTRPNAIVRGNINQYTECDLACWTIWIGGTWWRWAPLVFGRVLVRGGRILTVSVPSLTMITAVHLYCWRMLFHCSVIAHGFPSSHFRRRSRPRFCRRRLRSLAHARRIVHAIGQNDVFWRVLIRI